MQIPKMTQKRKINNFRESLKRQKDDTFGRSTYLGANGVKYVVVDDLIYQASKDGEPEYKVTIQGEPVPEFYRQTIQEKWEVFEAGVVPKEAGDIQRSEMRMAFVSGMVQTAMDTANTPEEALKMTDDIIAEGSRYSQGKPILNIYLEEQAKNA